MRSLQFILKGILCVALSIGSLGAREQNPVARATFNANGYASLPVGYRQWSHVGTRYKPTGGINILDGLPTKTPEILNAYVEPRALARFLASGKWPDGTQIVKEFSAVRVGDNCDQITNICNTPLGAGIYESGYIGLGMMVKDAKRFPKAPGNWGYFTFGHKPPPYDATAPLAADAQCAQCHVRLASDTDYVFTRAHIGLE
jgi:hypothetical protein